MDAVVEEAKVGGMFSYEDYIIVGTSSFQETVDKLKCLFQILEKHNLTLTPHKCSFHKLQITYLDFHIASDTIESIS